MIQAEAENATTETGVFCDYPEAGVSSNPPEETNLFWVVAPDSGHAVLSHLSRRPFFLSHPGHRAFSYSSLREFIDYVGNSREYYVGAYDFPRFAYALLDQSASHSAWSSNRSFIAAFEERSSSATSRIVEATGGELLQRLLERLFNLATDIVFEDGVENDLTIGLRALTSRFGEQAIEEIGQFLERNDTSESVVAEVLRYFGRADDARTRTIRMWYLSRSLKSESAIVRDGATVGLLYLDDESVLAALREAANREPFRELREDMELIIAELEEAYGSAPNAQED